jgi:hypothetical protein
LLLAVSLTRATAAAVDRLRPGLVDGNELNDVQRSPCTLLRLLSTVLIRLRRKRPAHRELHIRRVHHELLGTILFSGDDLAASGTPQVHKPRSQRDALQLDTAPVAFRTSCAPGVASMSRLA